MIISRQVLKDTMIRRLITEGKDAIVAETLAETCLPEMEGDDIPISDENLASAKAIVNAL